MQQLEYHYQANTELIPGYRLLEPLGQGGFGEVWKCEAPGGLLKAIKIVHGGGHLLDSVAPADEELRAIQHVKGIRHPFMLTMDRVEVIDGTLCIVMELADKSLADVLESQRAAGHPGIDRNALLRYLRETAEVLDVMNARHGLQHLDIKPRNLFLVSNHVKVGDFGLVNTLSSGAGALHSDSAPGAITPLYAAPEVFQGHVSQHSDQYSLAIVYQELLTGTLPFAGKSARQLLMQHVHCEPNLEALPEADRAIIARSLAKDPEDRFPSCTDLINSLVSGETAVVCSTIVHTEPAVETRRTPVVRTTQSRTPAVRPPALPPEVSGEIQVGELISRTPLTEIWQATGPQGAARLVKVLFGCRNPGDESIARLATLQHPLLQPLQVLHHGPGRLVLSTGTGETNFRELLSSHQAQGQPGVPRRELLALLRVFAEGLDDLAARAGLYHLSLNPRCLLIDAGTLRLADFGLAQLVWLPTRQPVVSLAARYAAPELTATASVRQGRQSALGAADQYSLALIYHELVTGVLPSPAPAARQPGTPAVLVDRLAAEDRPLIARALNPDPCKRWPSIVDLIDALESVDRTSEGLMPATSSANPTRVLSIRPTVKNRPAVAATQSPASAQGEVVQSTRFGTSLSAEVIRQRLEGFRQQWGARVVCSEPLSVVYQMPTPRSFWQRWTRRRPSLEIRLQITPPDITAPEGVQLRTELRMDLQPNGCSKDQSGELLQIVGPLLVESMRTHLQLNPRGRAQERIVWHHSLQVCSLEPDGTEGPPIECQGKDISLNGIGFYLPGQLPSSLVMLRLPRTPQTPQSLLPARIVRVQGCGDGWYEVGAVLLGPDSVPKDAEAAEAAAV